MSQKYVRTSNDSIVIFDQTLSHSQFRHLNPISAGTFSICDVTKKSEPTAIRFAVCLCDMKSQSLGISAKDDDDVFIARQLNRIRPEFDLNVRYLSHEEAFPQLYKNKTKKDERNND